MGKHLQEKDLPRIITIDTEDVLPDIGDYIRWDSRTGEARKITEDILNIGPPRNGDRIYIGKRRDDVISRERLDLPGYAILQVYNNAGNYFVEEGNYELRRDYSEEGLTHLIYMVYEGMPT